MNAPVGLENRTGLNTARSNTDGEYCHLVPNRPDDGGVNLGCDG